MSATQKSTTNLLLPQNVEDEMMLAHEGNSVALPLDFDFSSLIRELHFKYFANKKLDSLSEECLLFRSYLWFRVFSFITTSIISSTLSSPSVSNSFYNSTNRLFWVFINSDKDLFVTT